MYNYQPVEWIIGNKGKRTGSTYQLSRSLLEHKGHRLSLVGLTRRERSLFVFGCLGLLSLCPLQLFDQRVANLQVLLEARHLHQLELYVAQQQPRHDLRNQLKDNKKTDVR